MSFRIRHNLQLSILALSLSLSLGFAALPVAGQQPLADVDLESRAVRWSAATAQTALRVTISGPGNAVYELSIPAGDEARLSVDQADGPRLVDGIYVWEIRAQADLGTAGLDRPTGSESPVVLRTAGSPASVQKGSFRIADGQVVAGGAAEANESPAAAGPSLSAKDVVFIDDLIVDARQCLGTHCVNGETFNGDLLRLKQPRIRLSFIDTSTPSFPTRDWQLAANDLASGGRDRFSIEDLTSGRIPFTVEGNAPADALYIEDGGNVGFGTSTPLADLHVVTGDTPKLRLEQDGSSSFTPQIWDIAGNEANFFIRDETGDAFVFRIRPSAPGDSLTIDAQGEVGIGIIDASASLHVNSTSTATDAAEILVRNTGANSAIRTMLRLQNAGRPEIVLTNTTSGNEWKYTALDAGFQISKSGTGSAEMLLENDGDLIIAGNLTELSDRNAKRAITAIDPAVILDKVMALPIATWNRKSDEPWIRHLGPMAQDFSRLFRLGRSSRMISPIDLAGVGLASIQALTARVSDQAEVIEELRTENRTLRHELAAQQAQTEDRLGQLEERLAAINAP